MSGTDALLIVDDEPNIRRILQVSFEKDGMRAIVAADAAEAIQHLESQPIGCVLTDVTMPGMTGYELQREIRERWPKVPVLLMTAYGTIPQAVQAIRDGAYEYIPKPFDLEALKKVVRSAIREGAEPKSEGKGPARKPKTSFIAESPAMREVYDVVTRIADSRATVLITGESGTGKEVVATLIHEMSPRRKHRFVAVSCAALPETLLESELFGYEKGAFTGAQTSKPGRFELAHGGTLFLDEIGEIPMPVQVKLLRALQEREFERLGATTPTRVDVRLITATNRNLHEAVEQGIFRLDLLYRLQVVEIELPPLRQRQEDILPLAHFFLERSARENGRNLQWISDRAAKALTDYSWPGNVRELENVIERAVALSAPDEESLGLQHLPPSLRTAA